MRQIARHSQVERYRHVRVGINSRLDSIQAAILLEKLKIFDEELTERDVVATAYSKRLKGVAGITCPEIKGDNFCAWAQYSIQVAQRATVQSALKGAGIPTMIHYPVPLNKQPAVEDPIASCPVGDRLSSRILSLPMSAYLSEEEVDYISNALASSLV